MKDDGYQKRLVEVDLEERLGGKTPPDLIANTLKHIDALNEESAGVVTASAAHEVKLTLVHSSKSRWFGISAAAACVVAGLALMFFSGGAQIRGIIEGPGAQIIVKEYGFELEAGWVLADSETRMLRVGDEYIENIKGRALVGAQSAKLDLDDNTFINWLDENDLEVDMIDKAKKWGAAAGMSVVMLSGSALFNGEMISAQRDDAPDDKEQLIPSGEPAEVRSVADIDALPVSTRSVRCVGLKDAHLEFLERFTQLEHVEFPEAYLSDKGMSILSGFETLKSVDLRGVGKYTEKGLSALEKLPNLERLGLDVRRYNRPATKEEKAAANTDIDYNIGVSSKESAEKILEQLKKFKGLKEVMIRSVGNVSDEGMEVLAGIPGLVDFVLYGSGSGVTDFGLRHLVKARQLRKLVLQDCRSITDAGMAHLARHQSLNSLSLVDSYSDSMMPQIAKLKNLQHLSVNSKEITDEGLVDLRFHPNLKSLNLFDCQQVSDVGLSHISTIENLESLLLRNSRTARAFESFKKLKVLKAISLSNIYLDINESQLTLKIFAEMPSLKSLSIDDDFIGFVYLGHWKRGAMANEKFTYRPILLPKNLEKLSLYKIELRTRDIATLQLLSKLKELVLDDCEIENDVLQKLTKALPDTKIIQKE